MTAQYQVHDGVAVITLANPPINSLGLATREAVHAGFTRAVADPAVTAIVLTGEGKTFSGGADIREFGKPVALAPPSLHDLIAAFEGSPKPVIAALNGVCMGGGTEVSLGCHYRVAVPGAMIGLPEVKIGLLPGGGGTQRLPRLAGLALALEMIVGGEPRPADVLAAAGAVDRVIEGDFLAGTLAFAREAAASGKLPRARDMRVDARDADALLAAARKRAAYPHYPAPLKCIDAVEGAVTLPIDEGLAREFALFRELLASPESAALRHAFFAERAAARIADIPADTPLRDIRRVGIVGAGTMGGGIAMNFLNAGIPVVLREREQAALDRGVAVIRRNYEQAVAKGRMTAADLDRRMGLLAPTLAMQDLAAADLVIEAVFEDMAVKSSVFAELGRLAKPRAILASNTSTLDLDELARASGRPADVVGLHFFSPANVMKLLEVVRGRDTAPDVLATAMALAKRIRKTAVVSGVCDGFIGNRMIEQYTRQSLFMLEEGASVEAIDAAAEAFGFAMGPFRMGDLAGNDIGWAVRKRRYVERPALRYSRIADQLCEAGRLGQKTGAGWYDYRPGDRTAHPSATVGEMVRAHRAALGIAPRDIPADEIVGRLVYSLVNEAAHLLAEGIAQRASDVDLVYLTGYGFPPWRGGPLFHADQVGLANVVAAMQRFRANPHADPDFWTPAPLLAKLAAEGGRFNA